MLIRFLQTCPSGHPEYPFAAGQVIEIADPPPFVLDLCDGVRAEVLRTDDTERAIVPDGDSPELVKAKGRPRAPRP